MYEDCGTGYTSPATARTHITEILLGNDIDQGMVDSFFVVPRY